MPESHTPPAAVTVIGLGLMGHALAGALMAAGHRTTVWNRSTAKADQLVAGGADLAASPRDAVQASPLVIVCVTDHHVVRDLVDPLAEVLSGRVLVNLSSGTSAQARETAAWAEQRGVIYLDGAIMADPSQIGTADAVLLFSGPQPAHRSHEPLLTSLGNGIYLGADHGLSALYGVALLGIMWSVLNGFLHGAALTGTAGVKAATFAPLAHQLIGTVSGWMLDYAEQIDDGSYPAADATIDTHLAAMEHLAQESEALGVNAELPTLVKTLTERAVVHGHGGDGYAAMIEVFRASAQPA